MRKRRSQVEVEKRRQLLPFLLDQWVYFKYIYDNEEHFVFLKHRLRDVTSPFKVEQIVLSEYGYETGVYYITDFEIEKVFNFGKNQEIIQLNPSRFDLELGLDVGKCKLSSVVELNDLLVKEGFVTEEELEMFTDFENEPRGIPEIMLGMSKIQR
jgi:hypothetical protein